MRSMSAKFDQNFDKSLTHDAFFQLRLDQPDQWIDDLRGPLTKSIMIDYNKAPYWQRPD